MKKILRVSNLTKKYGEIEAVRRITFDVTEGDLFAFLGTNGAGKSTTINILTALIQKSGGEVFIDGLRLGTDDFRIKQLIGVVFQNSVLDGMLTVFENLYTRGKLYSLGKKRLNDRIKAVSQVTGCDKYLNQRYGTLSGGQKRRADIACALIHEPRILFLDEPTTGLDPSTRISIWKTISAMQKKLNTTVFLTTHYMEEAAKADDVVVIGDGEIIAHDSPIELKKLYTHDAIKIYNPSESLMGLLQENSIPYIFDKQVITITFTNSRQAIEILNLLNKNIGSFEVVLGTMDEVFINIINTVKA